MEKNIQVIMQKVYSVKKNGKKTFFEEKPLIAKSSKDEAIRTVERWNSEEIKYEEEYKGKYHLAFEYYLVQIQLF